MKNIKGILTGISIVTVIVGISAIVKRKLNKEIDVYSTPTDECLNCDKCSRSESECATSDKMILNWEECVNTIPVTVANILNNIKDSKDQLRYSCMEYLTYDHQEDIMVCYLIKQQRLIYIKFDLESGKYRYAGRKEVLCSDNYMRSIPNS